VLLESDPPEWAFPFADADSSEFAPSSDASAIECSICLEDDSGDGCNEYKLSCGHGFHEKCVGPWVSDKGTCPLCRASAHYSGNFGRVPRPGAVSTTTSQPPRPGVVSTTTSQPPRPRPPVIYVTEPVVRSRLVPIQTNDGDNRNYVGGLSMYVT
jgi:hypothetical protein